MKIYITSTAVFVVSNLTKKISEFSYQATGKE